MKVLITGGAGYLGCELTSVLAKLNVIREIVIYDNLSRGNYNLFVGADKLASKVRFVLGDLLDTRKIRSALEGVDVVVHLAARVTTPFADQNSHFFEQTNHWGTAELVYATEESTARKLVYLSSTSVYGISNNGAALNHLSPVTPKTFYGISKLNGERHVQRLMESGFDASIIRCGNVFGYGRSMRFDSVVNRFLFEANLLGQIAIEGNGEQHRSFVHIARVVDVIANMLAGNVPADIYNLVEATWSINLLGSTLKELFPNLNMISIDQNIEMRDLRVQNDSRLAKFCPCDEVSLKDRLRSLKSAFTFHYE